MEINEEQQIIQKFNQDQEYKKNEAQIRKDYITRVQIAQFSKQDKKFDKLIINAGVTKEGFHIFYICGIQQPDSSKDFNDFITQFCLQIDQVFQSKKQFILIYFNTGMYTHSNLSRFFQSYSKLPIDYYAKLKQVYILHGNVFIQSWFWFQNAIQINILKEKVIYVSKLSFFCDDSLIQMEQFNAFPQYIIDYDSTNLTLRNQVEEEFIKHPLEHQKSVEFVPQQVCGVSLSDYEINEYGIPIVIEELVTFMSQNKEILQKEGIFRKSASQSKENQLEQYFVRQQYYHLQDVDDEYAIAGLLKKIYNKMTTPIFPTANYQMLLQEMKKNQNINQFLREYIGKLPEFTFINLSFIMGFLAKVIQYKEINKMNSYNMAVVFGPCFIRPETYSFEDIKDMPYVNMICQKILDNYQEIFPGENYLKYLSKKINVE